MQASSWRIRRAAETAGAKIDGLTSHHAVRAEKDGLDLVDWHGDEKSVGADCGVLQRSRQTDGLGRRFLAANCFAVWGE